MAVSFIQSLFLPFGSGVLVPGTGVVLNNRAACFGVSGRVESGQRPYHTLMPGLLTAPDGSLIGPFGVMGGFIQAQAHVQFVIAALQEQLDPQSALDRGRFRVDGRDVAFPRFEGHLSAWVERPGKGGFPCRERGHHSRLSSVERP
jgi:gamma-glutamyltranspeptidase/glutathione hydrolase